MKSIDARIAKVLFIALAVVLLATVRLRAADFSVNSFSLSPGATGDVVVSGTLTGEMTFGYTILVEIVPRVGNAGTVTFTPSPPADIVQSGDPWPTVGMFTAYDTDALGFSATLNGAVDEDGRFLCDTPVDYSGLLATFPVVASSDADGVWDVVLSTVAGNSSWECLTAFLGAGTISVAQVPECEFDTDCDDLVGCTDDTCVSGNCMFTPNDANCPDDGLFCTGTEYCDAAQDCQSAGDPCSSGEVCDEAVDACVECLGPADCDDANPCTDDACTAGACLYTDNALPCDDGQFCTVTDVCSGGACVGSGDPCAPDEMCDEFADACGPPVASLLVTAAGSMTVSNIVLVGGGTTELVVAGQIGGDPTFGLTILVEILSRPGNIGSVTFTPSPPVDVVQRGDPWPGAGIFTPFDTDSPGFSATVNGSVDDNGTFLPAGLTYSGPLTGLPISASAGAGGIWDVVLSTSVGNSGWENVPTTLTGGTITVPPSTYLSVFSRAMPPGTTTNAVVSGAVDGATTANVDILLEIVSRPGNTGTLRFTLATDIVSLGNPWGGAGTFSRFDSTAVGFSQTLNGSVHGTFTPSQIFFSGDLTAFPIVASADAAGVWDLMLITSAGDSGWEDTPSVLEHGTITVSSSACLIDGHCNDSNTCTQDRCNPIGVCEYPLVVGSCNDGNLCTINDTCQADVCVGTPVDCSSLNNACNVGTCNLATGICERTPTNQGGGCDDGDPCTVNDTCNAGMCSGAPKDCSAQNNTCNQGSCNASTGVCEAVPANEGGACDDGDVCTNNDQCGGGLCSGTAVDCTHLTNSCNLGGCDPASGGCIALPIRQGLSCDDGNPCTTSDKCDRGACLGTPKNCSAQTNACNVGTCNGVTGNCEAIPTNEGGTCSDNDPCTSGDICTAGACSGTRISGCVNCSTASQCDDGNGCTADSCVGGVCQNTNTTSPCNDGNLCTINDTCSGGQCVSTPVDCSSLNEVCKVGVCNAGTGTCEAQPANEGGPCDDGYSCTINDACAYGRCAGTLTSPPSVHLSWLPASQTVNVGSTFTIALVASSGTCIDQPVGGIDAILNWAPNLMSLVRRIRPEPNLWLTSGFPYDAGLDGLNADCGPTTFCNPYTGLPYNDGRVLYQALRDFQRGVNVPPTGVVAVTFEFRALDGTHGTSLTIPSTAGQYTLSRVVGAEQDLGMDITGTLGSATVTIIECQNNADCNDGNLCTTDVCNAGVCENTNNTLSCNDGLFCTANDVCTNGACVGSGNPCTSPLYCSESLDACVQCLTNAHCSDGNVCTNDVCSATGTCSNPNNTISCNDGLFCTAVDQCSGGACVGTGARCPGQVCDEPNDRCVNCLSNTDCNDGNLCTTDTCNLTSNTCSFTPNTLPCDDGLFCTSTDTCSSGACVGVGNPCTAPNVCSETLDACVRCENDGHCNDGNPCTTDRCFFNTCSNSNNVAPCEDGIFCTATDVCSGGVCVGTGERCPGQLCDEPNQICVDCFTLGDCADDGVACTVDACVDGACVYPTNNALCDDGLFCNGPEFCHQTLGCRPGTSPCDDPALCDEAQDACGCQEPVVMAEGCRYLSVTPKPGATPVALLVTGADANVACVSQYVQSDGTLGPTPVFKTPGAWQTAHVRGAQVIPTTSYAVQTECETGRGIGRSTAAVDRTWKWADTNNSGGNIDVQDVLLILDGYRQAYVRATLYNVDIWGRGTEECRPDLRVELFDVVKCLQAFSQISFTCASPCP